MGVGEVRHQVIAKVVLEGSGIHPVIPVFLRGLGGRIRRQNQLTEARVRLRTGKRAEVH